MSVLAPNPPTACKKKRVSDLVRRFGAQSRPGKHAVRKVAGQTGADKWDIPALFFFLLFAVRILGLACIVIFVKLACALSDFRSDRGE